MMRWLLSVLLALSTLPVQAQLYNPDIHKGFPSYAWCHWDEFAFYAGGNGLSTQADAFSNFSTTTTIAQSVPVAVGRNAQISTGALQSSSAATGDSTIRMHDTSIQMGADQFEFFMTGREVTVSAAGEVYTARIGFFDSDTSVSDGVYFRYTHGTNSGEWEAVTVVGGAGETATDTNVAFTAGTARDFYILVDNASSNAYFYINGTLVATNTDDADIPNGSSETTAAGWNIQKTTHTAATTVAMAIDYMAVRVTYTTPRC